LMVVTTTILAPLWLKRVVAAPVSIESIVTAEVPKGTNPEVSEAPAGQLALRLPSGNDR